MKMLTVLAVFAALAGGCAAENILEGSLGEFYDLDFDSVRARLYSSELAIEYVTASGEVPVRVTVDRDLEDPEGSGSFDLGDVGNVTGSSGGWPIPTFDDGTLVLDDFSPKDRARVAGHFDVTFEVGASDAALHGEFSTRLDLVADAFDGTDDVDASDGADGSSDTETIAEDSGPRAE